MRREEIVCLRCGGVTHVADTRGGRLSVPSVMRRRECKTCRHRFTTYEIAISPDQMKTIIQSTTTFNDHGAGI